MDVVLRARLVAIAAVSYLAVVLLVTWQALSGQSIVHPDGPILFTGIAIAVAAVGTIGGVVTIARRK